MQKLQSIQITIPNPCHENWDEMKPIEQGRFCNHCQKAVIDFTTWTDTALYNFFSKNTGHVCGRFLSTQMDRPIHIPYQPHSGLYRLTVALGLTLLFAQTPQLLAQQRPPVAVKTAADFSAQPTVEVPGEIAGTILDDKKEPVINAFVQVFHGDRLIAAGITDYDGNYIMKPLQPALCRVVFFSAGYDTVIVKDVIVAAGQRAVVNQTLKHAGNVTQTTVVGYKKPLVEHPIPVMNDEISSFRTGGPDVLQPVGYQGRRGNTSIQGARTEGTLYIIDGVQIQSTEKAKHKKKKWWRRK